MTLTFDQIKNLENAVLEAVKKHGTDWKELVEFVEKCFCSRRVEDFHESQLRNNQNQIRYLEKEIFRHKTCIDNLRGYISFLETENEKLLIEKE